jgi:DNA primase
MGTAINEDQLRYLKKYTRRIVLALDADTAGEKATLRGVEVARQALDRETELTYDPRGLLKHEARLQADVRVTTLPEGLDPDDVVLKDPQAWQKIVDNAKPIVVHVMEALSTGQDLEDAKVRSSIAAQIIPLIEDVPSAVERDTYRQQLARLLKVDERSLMGSQKVSRRPRRSDQPDDQTRTGATGRVEATTLDTRSLQMEKHCLALLLRNTDRLFELERMLKLVGLDRLTVNDFEDAQNHELAQLLLKSVSQDELDSLDFVREHTNEELEERLRELLEVVRIEEKDEERLLADLYRTLTTLRLIRINQVLNQLRFLQDDPESEKDDKSLLNMILANTTLRGRLDQALARQPVKR